MGNLASGLAGQWCAVDETTYGVAPSLAAAKFYAVDNDTLQLKKVTKEGTGLFAGALLPKASRRVLTEYSVQGGLVMDLPERGMQQWLSRMLGSYGQSAATLTQDASTGAYKSVHTLGPLEGHSFALQKGAPTVDGGVVEPATYTGLKCMDWEVACTLGEIAKLTLTLEGRNELAGTNKDPLNGSVPALQPYVAPLGSVFRWVGATVFYGGTPSTSPLIAAPSAPVPTQTTSGGTVAAGTYQWVTTYVDSQGETVGSVAGPVTTTTGASTMTCPSPPAVPYATGWYGYCSQVGGTALSATRQQAAGSPGTIGTPLTLTAPPSSSGVVAPTVNTSGGITTVSGATVAGNVIGPINIKHAVPLDLNRFSPDVAPFRNEPLQNALRAVTGQFAVEWLSSEAYYNAYAADTATTIEMRFQTVGIGSGADIATFDVLIPNVRLEGESVKIPGPAVLTQVIPFVGLDDSVNNPLQVTYWTLDQS